MNRFDRFLDRVAVRGQGDLAARRVAHGEDRAAVARLQRPLHERDGRLRRRVHRIRHARRGVEEERDRDRLIEGLAELEDLPLFAVVDDLEELALDVVARRAVAVDHRDEQRHRAHVDRLDVHVAAGRPEVRGLLARLRLRRDLHELLLEVLGRDGEAVRRLRGRGDLLAAVPQLDGDDRIFVRRRRLRLEHAVGRVDLLDLHAERQMSFVDRLLPLHALLVSGERRHDDPVLYRGRAEVDADAVGGGDRFRDLLAVDGDRHPCGVEAGDGGQVDHPLVLALWRRFAGEDELRVRARRGSEEENQAENYINVAITANNSRFHRSAGTQSDSWKRF